MTASQPSTDSRCPLCRTPAEPRVLAEAGWLAPNVIQRLARDNPNWQQTSGACPACVQQALLQLLAEQGEAALHAGLQAAWPLDAEAAFGALPTPLRLHADPRYDGQGVTLALVDSGFYPHPDLTQPRNRIRAWVDAGRSHGPALMFEPEAEPRWPHWDSGAPSQWHGLMTSTVAAGNGWLSHGLYRGIASGAELVLVQVRDSAGRISNASLARGLRWLVHNGPRLGVRVVNLSVGGEAVSPLAGNEVDSAIAALVALGITVVAAAGNDGLRRLVPPATAPLALTVGGLDDQNTFDHDAVMLWHSNYGASLDGALKPELVAPSLWVAAPLLPDSPQATRARYLFARRAARAGEANVETEIEFDKLITPYYQHVEGTSFAAPVIASIIACMLQANPALTPLEVRRLLLAAAELVPGAPAERQGHGAIQGGQAVALAAASCAGWPLGQARSPVISAGEVLFRLHAAGAQDVRVLGSWDGWKQPGISLAQAAPGWWQGRLASPGPGEYQYKFVCDGTHWLADPSNAARAGDSYGGWNSVFTVPAGN
jgi:serine protease AprX